MRKINWGTVLSVVGFICSLAADYISSKDLDRQIDARIEAKTKEQK